MHPGSRPQTNKQTSTHPHICLPLELQESVIQWDEALSSIRAILEGWIEVQAKWAHLAPLFGPSGLPVQLPLEVCVRVFCVCMLMCVCKAFYRLVYRLFKPCTFCLLTHTSTHTHSHTVPPIRGRHKGLAESCDQCTLTRQAE